VEDARRAGQQSSAAGDPLQRALLEARADLLEAKDRLKSLEQAAAVAEEAAKVRGLCGIPIEIVLM
jgi:hypothetical protein